MSDLIEFEIDGKKIQAKPGQTVIQAADEAGIYIPRFCYHQELTIAANCRMCLVEVEKSPKCQPACAQPITPGLKVSTKSAKTIAAQRAVMEYLLINHPLDCPICDQGGECELQDLAMGYGSAKSSFCEKKRAVPDLDIGPLVATEMTRCIQCTRCVRFGDEIAGLRELGAVNRGEDMEITTYVQKALHSEVSGNIIDLCPVGALTSKPYRFSARSWELTQSASISPHDCVGTNINVHTRNGEVMRVVSRENRAINEIWLADRDRFSYEALYHPQRLSRPMVRLDGKWEEADWLPTLDFAVGGLRRVMVTNSDQQLAALASPNSTVEEFYLLQKLMRALGSSNIDHRLRQTDFSDQLEMPVFPSLGTSIEDLELADAVLLVGSNLPKEQPLAALRLRKAFLKGGAMMAVNPMDYRFHFGLSAKKIVAPAELVQALAGIAKALLNEKAPAYLAKVEVDAEQRQIAETLKQAKKGFVLLGSLAFNHPQAAILRRLARLIAQTTNTQLGLLTEGANAAGAWLAGAVPHRRAGGKVELQTGLDAQTLWQKSCKGYILMQVEPDLDCANPVLAQAALEQADFVIAFSTFKSPALEKVANVIFPIAPFTETSGTYVNTTGEWQSFKAAATLYKETQPAWKVLCSMANLLQVQGFRYESTEQIRDELKTLLQAGGFSSLKTTGLESGVLPPAAKGISRIGEIPLYAVDGLVRRAVALQEAQRIIEGELAAVFVHPDLGRELGLDEGQEVKVKQAEQELLLPLRFDLRIPPRAALIPGGISATAGLGELFGMVELS